MSRNQRFGFLLLVLVDLYFVPLAQAVRGGVCLPAGAVRGQHVPPAGNATCDPHFTYTPGPHDPSHWEGACGTGHLQSPIDITHAEKVSLAPLRIDYQPVDLDIFNDCNHYQIKVMFPENLWLKVGGKPYSLSEFHFHEPGENAVNGKRANMVIHLVHRAPESVLVIEVPVVVGNQNPVIKTLWEHLPEKGMEHKVPGVKINAADLLPANRDYYRFPGSLTTPQCNEGVTWYVFKNPIEMSEAQVAEYIYHNTARPLQPLNGRPVVEPKY